MYNCIALVIKTIALLQLFCSKGMRDILLITWQFRTDPYSDKFLLRGKFIKMSIVATAPGLDNEFLQYWLKLSLVQEGSSERRQKFCRIK
ncbi:MAG: hypothetical protein JWR09_597 [Mucilaginibacter sp.]|nr:hypothetical protein [Mucilaginibacter sp.]